MALTDLIAIPHVARGLKSRIIRATSDPAPSVFAQSGHTSDLDSSLIEIARNAIQPAVRTRAYRSLLKSRTTWIAGRRWTWTDLKWCQGRIEPILGERRITTESSISTVVESAAADGSPMVRRVAGEFLIKHLETLGDDSLALAGSLARDHSPAVAECGQPALSRLRDRASNGRSRPRIQWFLYRRILDRNLHPLEHALE